MPKDRDDKGRQYRNMGLAATAGTLMVSAVLIGYVGGVWLDGKFHTSPIFVAVGVILGMIAGFVELIRMIKQITDEPEDRGRK